MAMTGDQHTGPLKSGAPVVDYATGTTAAFAIATAMFQRERNGGKGQFVDVSMSDTALMLSSPYLTALLWNGKKPEPKGTHDPSRSEKYGGIRLKAQLSRKCIHRYVSLNCCNPVFEARP